MEHVRRYRRGAALAAAFLALLLTAQPTLAASWGPTVTVSGDENAEVFPQALAASSSALHLVYAVDGGSGREVAYRRSADQGATWSDPVVVSRPDDRGSGAPAMVVAGAVIHVVWYALDPSTGEAAVWYRRSGDGGASWGEATALSDPGMTNVGFPQIAVAGSAVVVAYTDAETGDVHVARSGDGGTSFQPAITVGTTTWKYYSDDSLEGAPALAAGTGVVYLAYAASSRVVKLRRSLDGGAHWTTAVTMETASSGEPRIAANGASAILVSGFYDSKTNSRAVVRRTTNKGATWTANATVSVGSKASGAGPIAYGGGRWRLLYQQCIAQPCATTGPRIALWYRDSADGVTWSAATRATNPARDAWTGGIAYGPGSRTWIAWSGTTDQEAVEGNVYVRSVK